jgi:FMN-dependent oxidoreductase (nitrilotriacetate monooxygenase family)
MRFQTGDNMIIQRKSGAGEKPRRLVFNLFAMNTPSHIFHGTWRHPDSRSLEYNNLDLWVELAQMAEHAKMDAIFLADVFGLYEGYGGSVDGVIENAVQFPTSDPAMLISAMSHATKNLGFVYTNSVLQQHPFAFARAISTLDHLTRGRVGWNIVTSFSGNGSRSMGLESATDHDDRYRWAEEYCEVTYKLWEGSWEDGAVVRDLARGVYADPRRVHKINHVGQRYSVEGPHLVEPSPQRTPVLFQAGASSAGESFAARHAEGAFMMSGSPEAAARKIESVAAHARAAGRADDDILFIEGLSFVVGSTQDEALRKQADNERYMSEEAQAIMTSGATGLDLSRYGLETPLKSLIDKAPGMHGALKMVIDAAPKGTTATVRDLLTASSRRFSVIGTPESIADRIQEYAAAGVNGINVMYQLMPGTYRDFIDHVVPVLQARGLMQREYAPGTLREKLYPDRGPRLSHPHPATRFRPRVSGDTRPHSQSFPTHANTSA